VQVSTCHRTTCPGAPQADALLLFRAVTA